MLSLFYCRCWDDTGAMRAASRSHVNPPPTCRRRRWSQGELEAAAAPSSPRAPRWQRTLCWRSFGGCREYGLCRGGGQDLNPGELRNQNSGMHPDVNASPYQWWPCGFLWRRPLSSPVTPARCTRRCGVCRSGWGRLLEDLKKNWSTAKERNERNKLTKRHRQDHV